MMHENLFLAFPEQSVLLYGYNIVYIAVDHEAQAKFDV